MHGIVDKNLYISAAIKLAQSARTGVHLLHVIYWKAQVPVGTVTVLPIYVKQAVLWNKLAVTTHSNLNVHHGFWH